MHQLLCTCKHLLLCSVLTSHITTPRCPNSDRTTFGQSVSANRTLGPVTCRQTVSSLQHGQAFLHRKVCEHVHKSTCVKSPRPSCTNFRCSTPLSWTLCYHLVQITTCTSLMRWWLKCSLCLHAFDSDQAWFCCCST